MENPKRTSPLTAVCKSCGARLEIEAQQEIVKCPYCGAAYSAWDLSGESDAVKVERIKAQTTIALEAESRKEDAQRARQEQVKADIEKFKKENSANFLLSAP